MRLPKSGSNVPVFLTVRGSAGKVTWVRKFADELLTTVHSFRNGRIEEKMGSAAIFLAISAYGDSIRVEQTGARILGLPLHRLLAPTVLGIVEPGPDDSSWHVEVRVCHPWLGDLCRYHGIMRTK